MAGLDLETFLRLLRADAGAWAGFGLVVVLLSLLTWTSWGSRRALRKCLILSLAAHFSLVVYGARMPAFTRLLAAHRETPEDRERIRDIQILADAPASADSPDGSGRPGGRSVPVWDRSDPGERLAIDEPDLHSKPVVDRTDLTSRMPLPDSPAIADVEAPSLTPIASAGPEGRAAESEDTPAPDRIAPGAEMMQVEGPARRSAVAVEPTMPGVERSGRIARDRQAPTPAPSPTAGPELIARRHVPTIDLPTGVGRPDPREVDVAPPGIPSPTAVAGDADVVVPTEPGRPAAALPEPAMAEIAVDRRRPDRSRTPLAPADLIGRMSERTAPIPLANAAAPDRTTDLPILPLDERRRAASAIPEVYRPRFDPDRSAKAIRAGASPASEQAVERALAWLKAHQDSDGRWNAGAARHDDGTAAQGEESFTRHCPPGEICFGECFYAEADTALTGLALLSYLGAGYTHQDGKYTDVVGKGLQFLLKSQGPDGDLRGMSRAVGMYCHAMASLALCEAYALTGDKRLREPVERAVGFALRSKSSDGLAWRYLPGDQRGSDTSILGWVVMLLKSAREVGIEVPSTAQSGALTWLDKVSGGIAKGLARYQPIDVAKSKKDGEITPTMTAEAWVCRQFLGVGGPGAASDEAARYLLAASPARGQFNIYYWYYGTIAMYQHGGESWTRWNGIVRDSLVARQRAEGHQAGSWDPDETDYGTRGGRIYGTALATLTLEVYYRYLRLYDNPKLAPKPPAATDTPVRRAGGR